MRNKRDSLRSEMLDFQRWDGMLGLRGWISRGPEKKSTKRSYILNSVSIQPRTGPLKFLGRRGVILGVPGVIDFRFSLGWRKFFANRPWRLVHDEAILRVAQLGSLAAFR